MSEQERKLRLATDVREACLNAAKEAYENAGISGLCEEGRWECALDAIRALDLDAMISPDRSTVHGTKD